MEIANASEFVNSKPEMIEDENLTNILNDSFSAVMQTIENAQHFNKITLFRWYPGAKRLIPLNTINTKELVVLGQQFGEAGLDYPLRAVMGKKTVIDNITDGKWPDELKESANRLKVSAIISVPIFYDGVVIGVINIFFKDSLFISCDQAKQIQNLCEVIASSISMKLLITINKERQARHVRSLAHESANLIKAIHMASEQFIYDPEIKLTEEARSFIYHIMINCDDAVMLLKNLAISERINMGDLKFILNRCDIFKTLKQLIRKRSILYEKVYSIKIHIEGLDGIAIAECDEYYIERAFENVIMNACKFSPRQGMIVIKAESGSDSAVISVIDQGPGIQDIYKNKVFDEFFVVSDDDDKGTPAQGTSGSGLGLFITKNIIEKHNGRIWVEDAFTKGSIFKIKLPLAEKREE